MKTMDSNGYMLDYTSKTYAGEKPIKTHILIYPEWKIHI